MKFERRHTFFGHRWHLYQIRSGFNKYEKSYRMDIINSIYMDRNTDRQGEINNPPFSFFKLLHTVIMFLFIFRTSDSSWILAPLPAYMCGVVLNDPTPDSWPTMTGSWQTAALQSMVGKDIPFFISPCEMW